MLIAMISSGQGAWPELGTSAVTSCSEHSTALYPCTCTHCIQQLRMGSSAGLAYKVS